MPIWATCKPGQHKMGQWPLCSGGYVGPSPVRLSRPLALLHVFVASDLQRSFFKCALSRGPVLFFSLIKYLLAVPLIFVLFLWNEVFLPDSFFPREPCFGHKPVRPSLFRRRHRRRRCVRCEGEPRSKTDGDSKLQTRVGRVSP